MGRPQKYLFDVSFDVSEPPDNGRPQAEPTFTRAELEAARDAAAAAAREAALTEASIAREERMAEALAALSLSANTLLAGQAELAREATGRAIAVLRSAIRKAFPALSRKDPLTEFETFVASCLAEILDEPRLVLRVNDALFDAVQSRISSIAGSGGYSGKIVLVADPALALGDGRVEWADGGAERDTARLSRDIDTVLARALTTPAPASRPLEENHDGRDAEPAAR